LCASESKNAQVGASTKTEKKGNKTQLTNYKPYKTKEKNQN